MNEVRGRAVAGKGRLAASAASRRRGLSIAGREELAAWVFILPWIVGFLAFTAGPMLVSLYLSFTETNMLNMFKQVGLQNYIDLFSFNQIKSLFWVSLYNTSYYVFLSVPLGLVVGFAIAVLLNQKIAGRGILRTIYYLPSVIPGIAVSLLWIIVFRGDSGIFSAVLGLFGIRGPTWLYSETWSKPALVIMSLWGAGGPMLILLAGLQSIPTELYDAAKVDGAAAWSRFWHITIPMVSPTLFFVLVTGIIGSFQVFVTSYVMTNGGPNNSTLMYVLYLFNLAFKQFRFGYASALAWAYFVVIMFFTVLFIKSSAAWVYYETGIGGE